jgi:MFS superfamily sulfate permease-like transporter
MTVVLATIVAGHTGNLAEAFTIVTLGGLPTIAFGMLRLGRYIDYTPISVVSGFTCTPKRSGCASTRRQSRRRRRSWVTAR